MRRPDNEPLLFDLPLDRPARDDEAEPVLERQPQRAPSSPQPPHGPQTSPRRSSPATGKAGPAREVGSAPAPRLPLASWPSAPATARPEAAEPDRRTEGAAAGSTSANRAGIGRRLAAGAADLLVHVAVAVLAVAGCRYLGVFPALPDWPALGVFLLSFSFLYTVVPLAFWGHTLGMTWAGLAAESLDGEPLSFEQTARRWLGTLVTLAALGLPVLLALTGRSLSDRLSGSRTFST